MMKLNKSKTATLMILSGLIAITMFSGTAYAITGNSKQDQSSYTGIVVLFSDAAKHQPIGYCTGFLISPTLMITAGHSIAIAAAVSVCFDKGPIDFEFTADGSLAYLGNYPVYNGAPLLYPEYVPTLQGNQEFATSDIGLILLDTPVVGVTIFPILPPISFADTLSAKTNLEIVGYGFQAQITPRNNGVMNSWVGTLSSNSAQAQLSPTNFAGSDKYLKLSANNAQAKGTIAFGDSGGPVIYTTNQGQEIALAVNAYVNSANCNGVSYHTRIDSPEVLRWISGYLA